jgi:GcrA cell cycle regulator
MDWTDEAVETLTEMWMAGATGLTIGVRLGCSRNAVIGKVHRLGLTRNPPPPRPYQRTMPPVLNPWSDEEVALALEMMHAGRSLVAIAERLGRPYDGVRCKLAPHRKRRVKRPPPPPKPKRSEEPIVLARKGEVVELVQDVGAVSFLELRPGHCRYVLGHPAGPATRYCGAQRRSGHAYCAAHYALCYTPSTPAKTPHKAAAE